MIHERVREWLMDHPEALTLVVGFLGFALSIDPDGTGGTSAFIGP